VLSPGLRIFFAFRLKKGGRSGAVVAVAVRLIVSHNIIVMWYHSAVRRSCSPAGAAARIDAAFRPAGFSCFLRYSLLSTFILFYSVLIAPFDQHSL